MGGLRCCPYVDFIFSLLAYRGSFHLLPCVAVNSKCIILTVYFIFVL